MAPRPGGHRHSGRPGLAPPARPGHAQGPLSHRTRALPARRLASLLPSARSWLPVLLAFAGAGGQRAAAQESFRLSGFVRNGASREVVRLAVITVDSLGIRVESNQDGFYALVLPAGAHELRVRAVGYTPLTTPIRIGEATTLDLLLTPKPLELEEVTVAGRAENTPDIDPASPEMSVTRLDLETIKVTPVVLGEADPIRSLTLLPGVSAVSDFSTGISVRGGGTDQNLILLDESTIYNPAHVFGFFSVFNAEAIDHVELYKGAIPARYGGRLSSVLDIRQREGNASEFEGSGTIGLLASRATFEGPLPGKVGSFLVAGRRTYADLFLKLSSDPDLNKSVAYFYDLNAKTNVRLGQTGALMLSGYFGRDRFKIADRFSASWGNEAATLRWNQGVGNRLFSKVTLTYSDYDYGIGFLGSGPAIDWSSRIRNLDVNVDQTFYLDNRNTIEAGLQATDLDLRPASIRPIGDSPVVPTDLQPRFGLATAAHLSHEVDFGPVSLRYGVRLSGFRRRGAATVARYADDAPIVYNATLGRYERGVVVDSVRYGPGETIVSYQALEPRVSARLSLGESKSLKASFSRTRQYLQLVSNTNSPTPVDIWEPVGTYLTPQRADQVAVGYAGTFGRDRYEITVEAYYKRLRDVADFIDGADLALNDRLETETVQGTGRGVGLELYLRKRSGRLSGWVSYTLSRAEQRFTGLDDADPGINGGAYYPAPYDRTHDLSVVAVYRKSPTWTIGSTFLLASGLPTTYPESRYDYGGLLIVEYGDRNTSRLPLYHRLDVTATRTWGGKQLQFGLYNLYNRFNAQSIAFRSVESQPTAAEAVQTSIFGIVPSVSFSFRF
ncbi:MAG: TonB-dependent receptor plug domain-containing protein [Gemmatimonadales bacterium]